MNEIYLYTAVAVAVVAVLYAFATRKQLASHKALSEEAASKVSRQEKRIKKLESSVSSLQESLDKQRQVQKNIEKKLEESQKKLASKDTEVAGAVSAGEKKLVVLERQIDNVKEQNAALTDQLSTAVREKKELSDELQKIQSNASKLTAEELKGIKEEQEKAKKFINKLKKDNKALKADNEKIADILRKVSPGELKKTKTKLSRTEQLYRSMKGLREMAEERSQNWETALRILASHITDAQDPKLGTGALVGQALEKIGAHLVIDEHTAPEDQPSEKKAAATSESIEAENGDEDPMTQPEMAPENLNPL